MKILVITVLVCSFGTTLAATDRRKPTESPSNSTTSTEDAETATESTEAPPLSPTDMETADICGDAYNRFKHSMIFLSANFLKRIHNTNPQTSVGTSPLSIARFLLALLSKKDKQRIFKLSNDEEIACIIGILKSLITESTAETVYVPINVGLDVNFTATEEFKDKLINIAYGEVIPVNASNSEEAAAKLNDMLAAQTENEVTDVISPESINESTPFIFAAAVYLKSDLAVAFKERFQGKFYVTPCKTVEATYLRRRLAARYTISAALGASAVELDYAVPNRKVLLILPDEGVTPSSILKKIRDFKVFNQLLDSLVLTDVDVSFPFFNVTFTTDLIDVLTKTNTAAFVTDPSSNKIKNVFVGDVSIPLSVAKLKIKNLISPDGGEPSSDEMPSLQATFKCVRPFIIYIMLGGIPTLVKVIANKS